MRSLRKRTPSTSGPSVSGRQPSRPRRCNSADPFVSTSDPPQDVRLLVGAPARCPNREHLDDYATGRAIVTAMPSIAHAGASRDRLLRGCLRVPDFPDSLTEWALHGLGRDLEE